MRVIAEPWDYLIVTAANDDQAVAYEAQLDTRRGLGLLAGVRETLVLADPGGRRVGSGGSTLACLRHVLNRQRAALGCRLETLEDWQRVLQGLRILIVHGGGDSQRLPAYGPCGKIFVPLPGEGDSAVPTTLFDRQIQTYLALPPSPPRAGQVVITAGDVLLTFDPDEVRFDGAGITGLGCYASPTQASKHGVFCADPGGRVRLFLQKAAPAEQRDKGAVDRYGRSILDLGVLCMDANAAVVLLQTFGLRASGTGELAWAGEMCDAMAHLELDFYREICCALGTQNTLADYVSSARGSGSKWDDASLERILAGLEGVPFRVQLLPQCGFLHFGTTRQIISSGHELLMFDQGVSRSQACLSVNNVVAEEQHLVGHAAWVEGCRITSPLTLGGDNVVVGVDVDSPVSLPPGACLDVIGGRNRNGQTVWFVRCYGVDDLFKEAVEKGGTLCNLPMCQWLDTVGLKPDEVWDPSIPCDRRTAWNAAVFPAVGHHGDYARWLWLFNPAEASDDQRHAYRMADRYSLSEIVSLADHAAFHRRRTSIHAEIVSRSLRKLFRLDSGFSSADSEHTLANSGLESRAWLVSQLLSEAHWHHSGEEAASGNAAFVFSRMMHSLGTAVGHLARGSESSLDDVLPGLAGRLGPSDRTWLQELGLDVTASTHAAQWADRAGNVAFENMARSIMASGTPRVDRPTKSLRSDEIVWGRAPARLDLAGGWSDTPPYSLEFGGNVINAAVDLNGQPPIQCYGRIIKEPVVRLGSIDLGTHVEIREFEELADFHPSATEFALAKAALVLSGFSLDGAIWPGCHTLREILDRFGGGVELTTLAAIPKGSGLGTSSITGGVILAVVQRLMGRELSQRELFHGVLRLEQALTTGGGWQDQVGGAIGGVKVIKCDAGMVPAPTIHYVPTDVLDPATNGGTSLLYYTGITRPARNLLRQVVGRYLNRDRTTMATLRQIRLLPQEVADAMSRKDLPAFGRLIDAAWRLNKQLDPGSSNEVIERILARVRPHIHGAKLLGAGGGGFLLMICKSPEDAATVQRALQEDPPNERARFFHLSVSSEGLVVTTC